MKEKTRQLSRLFNIPLATLSKTTFLWRLLFFSLLVIPALLTIFQWISDFRSAIWLIFAIGILISLLLNAAYGRFMAASLKGEGIKQKKYNKEVKIIAFSLLLVCIGIIVLLLIKPTRLFFYRAFYGYPNSLEYLLFDGDLLLIADFDDQSQGSYSGIDPDQRIYQLIYEQIPSDTERISVLQLPLVVTNHNQAQVILNLYNATELVWGYYDSLGIRPILEVGSILVREDVSRTSEISLAGSDAYVLAFTEDIPAQASYTSFLALGQIYFFQGIETAAMHPDNSALDVSIYNDRDMTFQGYSGSSEVFEDSIEMFEAAIESSQYSSRNTVHPYEAFAARGNIYSFIGEPELAIADYSRAIEEAGKIEDDAVVERIWIIYYDRGLEFLNLKYFHQSLRDQTMVISLQPNEVFGYLGRARTYNEMEDYESAQTDTEYAIALDPDYGPSYSLLGEIKWNSRAYTFDEILVDLNKGVGLGDRSFQTNMYRLIALFVTRKCDVLQGIDYGAILGYDQDSIEFGQETIRLCLSAKGTEMAR